jgi:hypothetical protein
MLPRDLRVQQSEIAVHLSPNCEGESINRHSSTMFAILNQKTGYSFRSLQGKSSRIIGILPNRRKRLAVAQDRIAV